MPITLTEREAAPPLAATPASVRSYHVVLNPASGANDADATRALIQRLLGQDDATVEMVPVASPGALARASADAAARALKGGGVLVAVGGDGTLNAVAQAAWRTGCLFGALPQGTFNYFGRTHGIPQDAEQAIRALLRARPRPVQVGEVNGRMFLVNASVGLYPQLLEDREGFKQRFGRHRWVAAISGLSTLFRWRHQLALEVEWEGERKALLTPTLFVGNNRLQFDQLGVDPAVSHAVGDGALGAIVASPVGTDAMLGLLVRGAFGKLGDADAVQAFALRQLKVDLRGKRLVKVATDGEISHLAPPLRFALSPRPLLLMLPRPEDRAAIE